MEEAIRGWVVWSLGGSICTLVYDGLRKKGILELEMHGRASNFALDEEVCQVASVLGE